jgi:REP element-mobilizing transposase RayT
MTGNSVTLDAKLRAVAKSAMLETAAHRGWVVHALDVRSNHVHVVVWAQDKSSGEVMRILKAYASRAMNMVAHTEGGRWWTRQGSKRNLFTEDAFAAAVRYVENQDKGWIKE